MTNLATRHMPKAWTAETTIYGTYGGVPFEAWISDCRWTGGTCHYDLRFVEPITYQGVERSFAEYWDNGRGGLVSITGYANAWS